MGKRLEDLPVSDAPLDSPDDDRESEWGQFLTAIEDLMGSGDYEWAAGTLSGIYDTVRKTRRATEGQRTAVTNIENARRERSGRWGRRYEGW